MNFKKFLLFTFLFIFTLSQACCEDNTIKVSGNAEIKVKPDIAIITVRVENTAKITAEALSAVNRKIASVIGILKANGVSDDDYSTSSFSINP